MTIAAADGPKTLDIGGVLTDGLRALGRNFPGFLVVAAVLHGLPTTVMDLSQFFPGYSVGYFFFVAVGVVIDLVAYALLMGALIYGTMRELEGRPAPLLTCLAVGRRYWLRMLGLAVLENLAFAAGLLLLVVPGVLLILRWAVASSAIVLEDRGVRDGMGRSAALTESRRWSLFLLMLILFAVGFGAQWCVNLTAGGYSVGQIWVRIALTSIVSVFSSLLHVSVFVALFRQLRGDRDGAAPDALAEVFA